MSRTHFFAKFLRFLGILFMALTAGFTLLGGIGTGCAAFFPTNPSWAESMGPLARLQWLYILYVVVGVALGISGVRAVVLLAKGHPKAYRDALLTLLAGVVIGALHIFTSRLLRGKSMPVDAVVYMTVLTLVLFLLLRIPWLWQGVDYSQPGGRGGRAAGGMAGMALGLLALVIPGLMASTHTWGGINYANAFQASMLAFAGISLLTGLFLLGGLLRAPARKKAGQPLRG